MSKRRILVPEATSAQETGTTQILLSTEKTKHYRKVLRMEWDEAVEVTDGQGRLFDARLEKAADSGAVVLTGLLHQQPKPSHTELMICLSKNATMDWLVEKAVECGVSLITPVVSSRSVVKPNPDELSKYLRRWQAIVDGAVEQSETLWRPEVAAPVSWQEGIARKGLNEIHSYACVSELRGSEHDERLCWKKLRAAKQQAVRVLIGPEGGLSSAEQSDLAEKEFELVSLGSQVLRVETAVIAALTVLRFARLSD